MRIATPLLPRRRDQAGEPPSPVLLLSGGEDPLFLHEIDILSTPRARILDLGAGTGTFDYFKSSATIVSLDRCVPAQRAPLPRNASFVQSDAASLPFSAECFDLVVSNFAFEHFARPALVLREVARITRPGGLLYISIPNYKSLEDRLFGLFSGGKHHVQRFSFRSLTKLLYQNTGFKLQSFADWPAGFTWLTPQPQGRALRRWLHYLLRFARPYLQAYSPPDSGYVLLFQKRGLRGFRNVNVVCSYCGAGATAIETDLRPEWSCAQCGARNQHPRRLKIGGS